MRIGIDLRMLGGGSGIDRYITELFQKVLAEDKTYQYVLFFRDQEQARTFEKFGIKSVITNCPHYSFDEQWKLPGMLYKENLDLVHFPHFNVPIFYRKPFVVTIHDLTHTLNPGKKKSRFFYRLAYHWVFYSAVKRAKKIIAVSKATKTAIIDYYKIQPEKIKVIYEGINQSYHAIDKNEAWEQVSKKFGLSKPYILYVGEWRRYKNLPLLAKAFDRLVETGLDLELVLVGKEDPFYPEINDQVLSIKHKERVKTLGRINDEDLNLIYNAAKLFVLPSLIEGFGLTVIEAFACKTAVACSDIPALREVAGDAAEFFDPENMESMTTVLKDLLSNPTRLRELSNLGSERVKQFSWDQAAKETVEAYL